VEPNIKARLFHQLYVSAGHVEQPSDLYPIEQPLDLMSCQNLASDLTMELTAIRSCSADWECGQSIAFGCGGSNDLVARSGADTIRYNELMETLIKKECSNYPLVTTCLQRETYGYRCNQGQCDWNFNNDISID